MAELLFGFMNLRDVLAERVVNNLVPVVSDAIRMSLEEHQRTQDIMRQIFTRNIFEHQRMFKTPVAGVLQPLSEDGRARKVKRTGYYQVGWPVKRAGTAWGANYETRVKMSVQEANDMLDFMLDQDVRWNIYQMLGALLTKEQYVFPDEEFGPVNVMPLANGDATLYAIRAGDEAGQQANHYLSQDDPIDDAHNPYTLIHRTLMRRPENAGGRVVCLIAEDLQTPTENLATFIQEDDPDVEDPNATVLTGRLGVTVPGEVIGKVGKCWIATWSRIPNGYIIAVVVRPGNNDDVKPLAFRQHPEPELQGFTAVAEREDHPYWERQFVRRGGYGAWNRVTALCMRIGGAYVSPVQFKQPFG